MLIPTQFTLWLSEDEAHEHPFIFRSGTYRERLEWEERFNEMDALADLPDTADFDKHAAAEHVFIEKCIDLISERVISLPFDGDIRNQLSYVQIATLCGLIRTGERIQSIQKKSSESQSSSNTESSTPPQSQETP